MTTSGRTPDSQWDPIPAFDRTKEKYIRLETEAWLRDHRIREIGAERGEEDKPAQTEQQPDDMHEKIRSWVNHRGLQCKEDVSRHVSDAVAELNDIGGQEVVAVRKDEVDEIRQRAETTISNRRELDRGDLHGHRKAIEEETQHFDEFRRLAGLTRTAVYPVGFFRTWGLVIVFAVFEVFVNASVLADVVPTGLLGAFSQMILITAINILAGAFVVSHLWREQNSVERSRRILSRVLLVVVVMLVFAFNLGVGHLRDSLLAIDSARIADPLDVLRNDAWERLKGSPFGYESFQSGLLVIVGLMFFGIAAWKGYGRDDAYPGYGEKDRNLRKLTSQYQRELKVARDAIDRLHREAVDELELCRREMDAKRTQWRSTVDRMERVVKQYPAHMRQYDQDLSFLLAAYRTANRNARSTPAPAFFDEQFSVDPDVLKPPIFAAPEEPSHEGLAEHIHEAIQRVQAAYGKALDDYLSLEALSAPGFTGADKA